MQRLPSNAVYETELPGVPLRARGKVRDIYDLDDGLLIVASDRLSAFDHVLPDPIPDKGKVLCQLAEFWFERFASIVPNHLVETDVARFPEPLRKHADQLAGRTSLVRKLQMVPIECVARGYLAGAGWKEYREHGTVCGIELPPGPAESARLPQPIFTSATKAEDGHDQNIPFEEAARRVGADLAARLRDIPLRLYSSGSSFAAERGIIIADTKFEFGLDDEGRLYLIDEVLTPDSSRFWPVEDYKLGVSPPSFDKQFVRDYLDTMDWDKTAPGPELPAEVVKQTAEKYQEALKRLFS